MWIRRSAIPNQVIVVLGSVTQMLVGARSEQPTTGGIGENLLSWSPPLNLGVLETLWFVRYLLRGEKSAEGLDQPTAD